MTTIMTLIMIFFEHINLKIIRTMFPWNARTVKTEWSKNCLPTKEPKTSLTPSPPKCVCPSTHRPISSNLKESLQI